MTVVAVIIVSMAACSRKDMNKAESSTEYDNGSYNYADVKFGAPMEKATEAKQEEALYSTSSVVSNEVLKNSQDKIIRRVNMEVETQDFDELIKSIDAQINQLAGYVESSNINGKRYYYNYNTRSASIIARIPKDRVDEFIYNINEEANVVNKSEGTENVTLNYIDTESRKKSLEIEQERLFSLLEKVDKLDEIITLESRLSSVRYELQNYEAQLRTYDNLVEYSTISLNIMEVERLSPKVEEKLNVWDRVQTGFGDSIYNISEGAKNFFVWFVINLPYFLIWGIIITLIAIVSRKAWSKNKLKNNVGQYQMPIQNQKQDQNQNQDQNQDQKRN